MGNKKRYFAFRFLNAFFNGTVFAYLIAGLDWIYHEPIKWLSVLVSGLVYGSIMGFAKPIPWDKFNIKSAIITVAAFATLWCLIDYSIDAQIHHRPLLFLSALAALFGGYIENKKKP